MAPGLFQKLSANTAQLLVNQACGFVIFYLLSTQLTKNEFGQLNLVLAILLAFFNLLSLGIDKVIIRRLAMGFDPAKATALYLRHVMVSGLSFYLLLLATLVLFPVNANLVPLLLFIGAGKLLIYFSTPFKQVANGLERFKLMAAMLVVSSLVRCCGLLLLYAVSTITIQSAMLVFVAGDLVELGVCIYLFRRRLKMGLVTPARGDNYIQLLKEAMPHTGVVFITSALTRFDWICLGILVSATKLAEYSFAYKVFELSTLPLLAIAPLLLPLFTRMVKDDSPDGPLLKLILRTELALAAITALVLNILWVPVVDAVTGGKYGASNATTIFILSLSIPLLYLTNFFWSIYFAQGKFKMILTGFAVMFVVNISLNLLLVPVFSGEGAALAFLATCTAQTVYYFRRNELIELRFAWHDLLICTGAALAGGLIAKYCFDSYLLVLFAATFLTLLLLVITGRLRWKDFIPQATLFALLPFGFYNTL